MKLFSIVSLAILWSLNFSNFNNKENPRPTESCNCDLAGKVWVWDGGSARLTSAGQKKLDKLRQQLNDKAKIKQQMYASDFEYMCTKIQRDNPNRCPQGNPYGAPKGWVKYSEVCNKPNYCPIVPGL